MFSILVQMLSPRFKILIEFSWNLRHKIELMLLYNVICKHYTTYGVN